jgi:hypothetical protein
MPTLRTRLRSFWEVLHRWVERADAILMDEIVVDKALEDERTRHYLQRSPQFNAIRRILTAASDVDDAYLLWRESRSDIHLIELEKHLRGLHAARLAVEEHREKEE